MRKSKSISITVVSAVSLSLLTGCSSETYTRRCVDERDIIQNDARCHSGGSGARWIYMGNGSTIQNGRAYRYSNAMPESGAIRSSNGGVVRSNPTSRGGFGNSGSGYYGG